MEEQIETEGLQNELEPQEEVIIIGDDSEDAPPLMEGLLTSIIRAYQDHHNNIDQKFEHKYLLTITHQKLPTVEGNKNIAYLRLSKSSKDRAYIKLPDDPTPEWTDQLIHQELHIFKNMRDQINPKAPWKEQLFTNALVRLVGGGVEYGVLLQKMKKANIPEMRKQDEMTKSGLVITQELPKALTPDEEDYKDWVKKNSEYAK